MTVDAVNQDGIGNAARDSSKGARGELVRMAEQLEET